MTDEEELEELEYLRLKAKAAQGAKTAPAYDPSKGLDIPASAPRGPLSVGAGETFLNKTGEALPLGRQVSSSLGAMLLSALQPHHGVRLTPRAAAELGTAQEAPSPGLAENYRKIRDSIGERTEAGALQNPKAALAGTVLGTGLSLAAPLPKVSVGSGAAGRVLSNALTAGAYGAVNGAANSRGDLTKGEVGQVLKDAVGVEGLQRAAEDAKAGKYVRAALDVAGAGGLGGLVTGGVLGTAGELARKPLAAAREGVGNAAQSFANRKALNALGAMKPQLNALGSEEAQKLGQYALEKGIVSPLASRATMADRVDALRKGAGSNVSGVLDEVDRLALPQERLSSEVAARNVERLASETAQKPALRNIANKFRNEAENIRASAAGGEAPGGMSLRDFEETVARPYKQTTNWNADIALPKETLKQLPRALESEVERVAGQVAQRTGKGDLLSRYQGAKQDYGKLAELRDIAEEGLKRQASNHTFSLKDIMLAGPAMAGAASHGAMGGLVGGGASLIGSKLANRFGDQMSATTAAALAKALSSPSQGAASGRTAELLANALGLNRSPVMAPQMALNDKQKQEALAQALAAGGSR